MPSIFSEEDLYDMGFDPISIESHIMFLDFYHSQDFIYKNIIPKRGKNMHIYPLVGASIPFPGQIFQFDAFTTLEMKMSRDALEDGNPRFIGIATERCFMNDPALNIGDRINKYGVLAKIIKVEDKRMEPGAEVTAIIYSLAYLDITKSEREDSNEVFMGYIKPVPSFTFPDDKKNLRNLDSVSKKMKLILKSIDSMATNFLINIMQVIKSQPERLINFMCQHVPTDCNRKYELLPMNWEEKIISISEFIDEAIQEIKVRHDVIAKANEEMSMQRREMYLRSQMHAIKSELGENIDDNSDITSLLSRAEQKVWSEEAKFHFHKELQKLKRFNIAMPEYSIQYNYLDMLLNLPWSKYSMPDYKLADVRNILDSDHFGLEKIKERIIEHMAVHKLRGDMKAPILCFVGAPGVGKTSLGKSIAKALGRDYYRIALGGVSDEAEIRGHRRTYVGAMAGRIMAALSKCKVGNPVIVLDEIDKIGKGLRGDPSQALLEVLDPEQNIAFHDNYVDLDYDLSNVFFIATANSLDDISGPLLDRMEVIEIPGYVIEEKIEIALIHLLPKALRKNGFEENEVKFTREAIKLLIESYTRESGVRSLEKKISSVLRKIACLKVDDQEFPRLVTPEIIKDLLGKEVVNKEVYEDNSYAGVVTGLAWTAAGGEILFIETSVSNGKGEKLTLTGNLGNVMKESATIAVEYVKSHSEKLGIAKDLLDKSDIHIHVPEGAVPKDGPSAGITMTVSIASALTKRKVREKLAMTGEMTLRGKVLPVGGIKEKILAARRAGIREIILCSRNRKDVEEIPSPYLENLHFNYVDHIDEVLSLALENEQAEK